ncbi:hypothetical protein CHRY9293_03607 [Chryseobacterium potabilaquae]|uniref:Uncharacterized protein n=1 Tax=Chryseobacterium potabilaquae TaxID=2675057 RepID=A0A6N4X966_9FLAO|nr:hypothetical protein CHRY9293_03607 [Chryseobacterium potabilaquae]
MALIYWTDFIETDFDLFFSIYYHQITKPIFSNQRRYKNRDIIISFLLMMLLFRNTVCNLLRNRVFILKELEFSSSYFRHLVLAREKNFSDDFSAHVSHYIPIENLMSKPKIFQFLLADLN